MWYVVSDDDAVPGERNWWAIMRARVVDELTEVPPLAPLRLTTTTPRCTPRIGSDGICGLVARPVDVASALTTPGALTAEVSADGYLPRSLTDAIDAARRQIQPPGAAIGDDTLIVAPPDPAPRAQFLPGRGVLLARPMPPQAEQFTTARQPLGAVPANQVPLADRIAAARPSGTRLAGVPIVPPTQALHRRGLAVVRTRVRREPVPGASPIPAPGANVGLIGVWWSYPEVRANSGPPHAPNFVSFAAPLAFDHDTGVAVERCTLAPDATVRRLQAGVQRDGVELLLSWAGLNSAGGDVLQIEPENSGERELVVTAAFTPPTNPEIPALLRLRTPLAFPHRAQTQVVLMNVAAVALGTIEREAQRGDCVLFANTLAGVATDAVLRVAHATPHAELRFVRRVPIFAAGAFSHTVVIQADGSFDFPRLARIAQMRLHAEHAGQTSQQIDVALDYVSDNLLEILFKP
jgi:hypothetical protein